MQSDGATLRDHYEILAERTGRTVREIHGAPDLPDGCSMLWRDFIAMHGARGSTGFGPMRITWADLDAFQRVMGIRLAPWELEAIRRADGAYLESRAKSDG